MTKIAIIDSGVKNSIQDEHIKKCITIEESLDGNGFIIKDGAEDHYGHGTAIFSIINKSCTNTEFYIIKIFEDNDYLEESLLLKALEYIEQFLKVNIINLSLGLPICGEKEELYKICSRLVKNGVILISAFDNSGTISYPAAFDCVIGVKSGTSCLKTTDFEYVEDSYVNLGAKGGIQRVAWTQPPYLMIGGNSFAAAHVTAMAVKFVQEGAENTKEVLDCFKSIAKKCFTARKAVVPDQKMKIEKAAIFPFNKEMHSLVRFRELLDFEITGIFDTKYSAKIGTDVAHILNDSSVVSQKIQNIDEIDWSLYDTIILGHTDELERNLGERFNKQYIIEQAVKNHVFIYSFDEIPEFTGDDDRYFHPSVTEEQTPPMRFGMLHQHSVPVVGIFGTSSQQGKFTLQLKLRKELMSRSYNVGQIGTEPSGLLYGMDYTFPMGYNGSVYIKEDEVIRYLNDCMHRMEQQQKEIIIVGSQSGTVPYDYGNLSYYTISQYLFLLGTRPDIVYLCVNSYDESAYIERTIYFIESAIECKVCGIVVFPMKLKNDWLGIYGGKEALTTQEYRELKEVWGNEFSLPVYFLSDNTSIKQLCDDIIHILSHNPEE